MVCSGTAARFQLVTSSEVRATRSGSSVTVYEPGGRVFDTFTADCRL